MTDAESSERTNRNRQSRLNKSMDTLFPQSAPDKCRVCEEEVVDGRWNYCSERCREIANAVQSMFIWDKVRDQILERDEHTCQECGLTKEMQYRAYWQTREIVKSQTDDNSEWLRLWEQYGELDLRVMEVDHIQPLAKGGHPFAEDNLQTLCEYCHTEKTADQNRGRETAPDVTLEDYLEA